MSDSGATPRDFRELRIALRCWEVSPLRNPSFQAEVWMRIRRKENPVRTRWQRRRNLP